MKDTMKTSGTIKGHTKIELFNKNGELDYSHEESNIFSNFWLKYANSLMWARNQSSVSHPKGFMWLYNSDKTAEEIMSTQLYNKIEKVGSVNLYATATATGKVGTINSDLTSYFTPNLFKNKSTISYVCDFPAGVATGSFNTISLCYKDADTYTYSDCGGKASLFKDNELNVGSELNFITVKKNGLLYCSPNISTTGNIFHIVGEEYQTIKTVTPPIEDSYYSILDLEPTNNNVLYIQVASTKDVYKWNLENDTFEKVATWSSYVKNAIGGLKDGKDIIILMVCGNDFKHSTTAYFYLFVPETFTIGERLTYKSNSTYDFINIVSKKRKDGEYTYLLARRYYYNLYNSTEELLNETGLSFSANPMYSSIVDWNLDENTGNVKAISRTKSNSQIYIIDLIPNKYTVNKLSDTVTKTADQTMRITYTLEVDL